MSHEFPADGPQQIHVELHSGDLTVVAQAVDQVTVEVAGGGADEVVVERRGDDIAVVAPRRTGFLSPRPRLSVTVTAPVGSHLVARLGSAGVTTTGRLGAVRIVTGSGEVSVGEVEQALVKTGSGDIRVLDVGGECELKAGSGEISVGHLSGSAHLVTGSGGIRVGHAAAPVSLKSGSGDLVVDDVEQSAVLSTATGDLRVGRARRGQLQLKNVSGDISLGVPAGIPVWTDITSNTGQVRSDLSATGAPAEGQEYVEVRARTVTGDVYLEQL
jgi:hypothetical protein